VISPILLGPTIVSIALKQAKIVLIVIYCLGALFTFIQQYIMAKVTLKMSYRMRKIHPLLN